MGVKGDIIMRVFVYRNLRTGTWSVKSLRTGRVILHDNKVNLENCVLKVSQRGKEKVREQRQKNVHAGVVGDLVTWGKMPPKEYQYVTPMTYNPYRYDRFVVPEVENWLIQHDIPKHYKKRGQICIDAAYVRMDTLAVNPVVVWFTEENYS
jgi:hypothetical protein